MTRFVLAGVLVAATVLVVLVCAAPAAWIGAWIEARGPWRIVHADGTLWRGSASVGVEQAGVIRLLPGRVAWRFMPGALLTGRVALSLAHPAVDNRVELAATRDGMTVTAAAAQLPAAMLVVLGAPFNTVRPGGALKMAWSTFRITDDAVQGHAELEWENARSALSPVAPLGTFRLTVDGRGHTADLGLATIRGPLRLAGHGTADGRRVRFTGTADAAPEFRPRLGALLGVLGRRTGDKVVLDWEMAW